jgi:hypothetical protein
MSEFRYNNVLVTTFMRMPLPFSQNGNFFGYSADTFMIRLKGVRPLQFVSTNRDTRAPIEYVCIKIPLPESNNNSETHTCWTLNKGIVQREPWIT